MAFDKMRRVLFGTDDFEYIDFYEFNYWCHLWTGLGVDDYPTKWQSYMFKAYRVVLYFFIAFFNYYIYGFVFGRTKKDLKELALDIGILIQGTGMALKFLLCERIKQYTYDLRKNLKTDLNRPYLKKADWYQRIKDETKVEFKKMAAAFIVLSVMTYVFFLMPPAMATERELPLPSPYNENMGYFVYVFFLLVEYYVMIVYWATFVSYDLIVCGFLAQLNSHAKMIAASVEDLTRGFPSVDYEKSVPDYSELESVLLDDSSIEDRESFPPPDPVEGIKMKVKYRSFDEELNYDAHLMREINLSLKNRLMHYQELIKIIQAMNKMYGPIVFLQLVCGAFLCAFLGAAVFMGNLTNLRALRQFGFTICGAFNFFLYCYFGTKFRESRENFCFSLYSCPWYEMDIPVRKFILGSIQMVQYKVNLRAINTVTIDLRTYLKLLKLSYNSFAFLENLF